MGKSLTLRCTLIQPLEVDNEEMDGDHNGWLSAEWKGAHEMDRHHILTLHSFTSSGAILDDTAHLFGTSD